MSHFFVFFWECKSFLSLSRVQVSCFFLLFFFFFGKTVCQIGSLLRVQIWFRRRCPSQINFKDPSRGRFPPKKTIFKNLVLKRRAERNGLCLTIKSERKKNLHSNTFPVSFFETARRNFPSSSFSFQFLSNFISIFLGDHNSSGKRWASPLISSKPENLWV